MTTRFCSTYFQLRFIREDFAAMDITQLLSCFR